MGPAMSEDAPGELPELMDRFLQAVWSCKPAEIGRLLAGTELAWLIAGDRQGAVAADDAATSDAAQTTCRRPRSVA